MIWIYLALLAQRWNTSIIVRGHFARQLFLFTLQTSQQFFQTDGNYDETQEEEKRGKVGRMLGPFWKIDDYAGISHARHDT